MNLYIRNHPYHYEMENLTRAFFFTEDVRVIRDPSVIEEPYILTSVGDHLRVEVCVNGEVSSLTAALSDDNELTMARLLYTLLSRACGRELPWGILTGVRPIKLFSNLCLSDGEEAAARYFRDTLFVSEPKVALARRVAHNQHAILSASDRRSFSLYVSIPFCPTRCSYCSFVSQSIERAKKLIDGYLPLLLEELRITADIARELNQEGITSAKVASTQVEGLGFAIPIDEAKVIIDDLIRYGYVKGRPTLGISGQNISSFYAQYYGVPEGFIVRTVESGSAGENAGIRVNDIIVGIEGELVSTIEDFNEIKSLYKAGDTIKISVYRDDKIIDLDVTLDEANTTITTIIMIPGITTADLNRLSSNNFFIFFYFMQYTART